MQWTKQLNARRSVMNAVWVARVAWLRNALCLSPCCVRTQKSECVSHMTWTITVINIPLLLLLFICRAISLLKTRTTIVVSNGWYTLYQIPFIQYLYQIPLIKFHLINGLLSNIFYQIPFIKYCLSNTIYQILFAVKFFFNESMNQWMNQSTEYF